MKDVDARLGPHVQAFFTVKRALFRRLICKLLLGTRKTFFPPPQKPGSTQGLCFLAGPQQPI